ncbi:hypothetical protein DFP72DRAFT_1105906 [Ephemerocybe angulata]|uniref:Uncharacterized protein n=1 Tax=Ephemerocybe angulata TaxID=980116 RepID=A0A8H6LST3_9AGAR|nr:hypothetical protein DFP72DRAFT_1105906 [Tulosesus angulatus]
MQFKFSTLLFSVATSFALLSKASPAPFPAGIVSFEEIENWLATTDAKITYIGVAPTNPLSKRAPQNTRVVYCSNRTNNVCGGPCTVYDGGAACLNTPDTNCLSATHNVGFCDRANCNGSCNELASCGTRLDNGFCFTPGTRSIIVSSA